MLIALVLAKHLVEGQPGQDDVQVRAQGRMGEVWPRSMQGIVARLDTRGERGPANRAALLGQ